MFGARLPAFVRVCAGIVGIAIGIARLAIGPTAFLTPAVGVFAGIIRIAGIFRSGGSSRTPAVAIGSRLFACAPCGGGGFRVVWLGVLLFGLHGLRGLHGL